MCRKTTCSTCQKPTWAGCGNHIESALAGVSVESRCPGWRTGRCTSGGADGGEAVLCSKATAPGNQGKDGCSLN